MLWGFFSYYWVCALLLCQEQRKCLSKSFSHELVEIKRFPKENKAVTLKEEGASKKSGKDKSVRIFICTSGEGRDRSNLHGCNVYLSLSTLSA